MALSVHMLGGRHHSSVTRRWYCAFLLCVLLPFGLESNAQVIERRTPIGVIKAIRTPLSPDVSSSKTEPPLSPPVVGIDGQPVRFDTRHAGMAHQVVVESFGGGSAGEDQALHAQKIAASLAAMSDSFGYRFSRAFDGSAIDAVRGPADLAQTSPGNASSSTPVFGSSVNRASQQRQAEIMQLFDNHVPGGVVLDGLFDPGSLSSVVYDARYHALVLGLGFGTRVAYLSIPAADVSTLCRAIAGDERGRVAVSMEHPPLAFGALIRHSDVALNMFVADQFLGALVFGTLSESSDMITDFQSPEGYVPSRPAANFGAAAVMFTFKAEGFGDDGRRLQPNRSTLDILFVPLAKSSGAFVAAMTTDVPDEFLENARHITENLDYYRGEPIVNLMFHYAQVSALLRGLKTEGVDLGELARAIEFANGDRE